MVIHAAKVEANVLSNGSYEYRNSMIVDLMMPQYSRSKKIHIFHIEFLEILIT